MQDLHVREILPQMITLSESYIQARGAPFSTLMTARGRSTSARTTRSASFALSLHFAMGDRARDKMVAAMHARKTRQEAQRIADMARPIPEDNKGRCPAENIFKIRTSENRFPTSLQTSIQI